MQTRPSDSVSWRKDEGLLYLVDAGKRALANSFYDLEIFKRHLSQCWLEKRVRVITAMQLLIKLYNRVRQQLHFVMNPLTVATEYPNDYMGFPGSPPKLL